MRTGVARIVVVALAGLWLAGCNTTGGMPDFLAGNTSAPPPAEDAGTQAMAAVPPAPGEVIAQGGLFGADPNDSLAQGKQQYRAGNYGLAEKHFRKAVETHPRDAEAWLGLAASYDRLRRFDLADRAYAQAISLVGPTAEILNNQGFSYMLRGDYAQARAKLAAAQRRDPGNRFAANNLHLLNESIRQGKAVE